MAFPDHFSAGAADYASYRPSYPPALFRWLASVAPDRRVAWDCGTGSGQTAVALAEHVGLVVGTDPSTSQLGHAVRHPRVRYAARPAERAAIASASAGLITVAQALHWFDQPAFFGEVRRVLAPGGVLAVWSYGLLTFGDQRLDSAIRRFHGTTVGPFWPAERRMVDEGYRSLELPLDPVDAPPNINVLHWDRGRRAPDKSNRSAVQRARAETGVDPVPGLIESLRADWGAQHAARRIAWPLTLRVGRKEGGVP
jgi:SAM-dependent methyltransferase